MSVLLQRCGVEPRKVPLTCGQNIAKQLAWFLCKAVIVTVLVLAFIWAAFAAFL